MTEYLWNLYGNNSVIDYEKNSIEKIEKNEKLTEYKIFVNGKYKISKSVYSYLTEDEIKLEISKFMSITEYKNIIFVKNKLLNFIK